MFVTKMLSHSVTFSIVYFLFIYLFIYLIEEHCHCSLQLSDVKTRCTHPTSGSVELRTGTECSDASIPTSNGSLTAPTIPGQRTMKHARTVGAVSLSPIDQSGASRAVKNSKNSCRGGYPECPGDWQLLSLRISRIYTINQIFYQPSLRLSFLNDH